MVPFNCFLINDRLTYFDQEFVRENCPVGYVMYRAIMYTYLFVPVAECLVPLEEMKKRYNLTEFWEIYRIEEDRFGKENRQRDLYHSFYRWTEVDKNVVVNNAIRLMN